jgi:hypothetical protein
MLRWTIALLIVLATIGQGLSADESVAPRDRHPLVGDPLAGRRHYKSKEVVYPAPIIDERSELLFTPENFFPYIPPLIRAPLLPGSSTLPGYYGAPNSYDYPGPYYGGPNPRYWTRLPYACGVYGYC